MPYKRTTIPGIIRRPGEIRGRVHHQAPGRSGALFSDNTKESGHPSYAGCQSRTEKMGVITSVEEPTEWCAGMVVVPKSQGKVKICVDLTKLNNSVCRERYPLPAVEQTLAQIAGACVFSKLDANSGFWQIPLARESSLLTTFITPFGRYRFNRLPFGISSAPEHFQRRMAALLKGLCV